MPRLQPGEGRVLAFIHVEFNEGSVEGEVALLEEPGEAFQPPAGIWNRQRRLRFLGKEAAHQLGEPGVVLGVAQPDDQLLQRRRTPQEQAGQVAQ